MKKVVVFTRSVLLLSTFLLVMSLGKGIHAKAATYDKVVSLQMVAKNCSSVGYIQVDMEGSDDHIANLKSSSKNLKAMISTSSKEVSGPNAETLDVFATKKGKYVLKFDVVDGTGNVKSSEQIKIIVRTEKELIDSFKSIKLGKVDLKKKLLEDEDTTKVIDIKKTGKLKIRMRKGCKLKNIRVGREKKQDTPIEFSNGNVSFVRSIYEDVKNNSVLTLSDSGYNDGSIMHYGDQTLRMMKSVYRTTSVELTYTDKSGALGKLYFVLRTKNN